MKNILKLESNKLNRRPYQVDALRAFRAGQVRLFCLLWERQSGKSTTLADMSLEEMVRRTRHTCVACSTPMPKPAAGL
jgi:hypothetical protein